VLKEEGKYDQAAQALQSVLAQYPQDRVVHDELGHMLFLQKRYADAVKELQLTLAIDPEDLQESYNLMLCYTGLGDDSKAKQFKERYLRFKADEASQALTGPYRQAHPEDNNERQAIHPHVSLALCPKPATKSAGATASAKQRKPSADAGR
jgi:predicted Zn-dependent protease